MGVDPDFVPSEERKRREPLFIDLSRGCRLLRPLEITYYAVVVISIEVTISLSSNLFNIIYHDNFTSLLILLLLIGLAAGCAIATWFSIGNPEIALRPVAFLGPAFLVIVSVLAFNGIGLAIALLATVALIDLRRTQLTPIGKSLRQVIRELNKERKSVFVKRSKPRNLSAGISLMITAIIWLFAVSYITNGIKVWISSIMGADLLVQDDLIRLLTVPGFVLLFFSRSFFAPSAEEVLHDDGRAPILLLRSFRDDHGFDVMEASRAFFDFSLEARLSSHFEKFGPFVAVSSPRQKITEIGAARLRLSDSEWQERVHAWMGAAQAIIYIAGITHWALWELKEVVTRGYAEKLIVVFPEVRGSAKYPAAVTERLHAVKGAFAGTAWGHGLANPGPAGSIRSISFEPGGDVIFVTSNAKNRSAYQLGALIAHYLMLRRTLEATPAAAAR
jgi:hypothetical protein